MTKRNSLSYPETAKLHKFLENNLEILKGQNLDTVAAQATDALEINIKRTNVLKLNREFNLGLGARIIKKKAKPAAPEDLAAFREEYEIDRKETTMVLAGLAAGLRGLYDDLGATPPPEYDALLKLIPNA
jgi:hypothetical protein